MADRQFLIRRRMPSVDVVDVVAAGHIDEGGTAVFDVWMLPARIPGAGDPEVDAKHEPAMSGAELERVVAANPVLELEWLPVDG